MYPAFIRPQERDIIDRVLRKVLADEFLVSVYDGEAHAIRRSSDYEAITSHIAGTDVTSINLFVIGSSICVGSMIFIHGNDEDVIHDHTDKPYFEELFRIGVGPDHYSQREP